MHHVLLAHTTAQVLAVSSRSRPPPLPPLLLQLLLRRGSGLIAHAGQISVNDFKNGVTIEVDSTPFRVLGMCPGVAIVDAAPPAPSAAPNIPPPHTRARMHNVGLCHAARHNSVHTRPCRVSAREARQGSCVCAHKAEEPPQWQQPGEDLSWRGDCHVGRR